MALGRKSFPAPDIRDGFQTMHRKPNLNYLYEGGVAKMLQV